MSSEFKYYPIRFYVTNGRRVAYSHNPDLCRSHGDYPEPVPRKAIRVSQFFIDYHLHSEQLVDALQEWVELVRFTSRKYEGGLLQTDFQDPIGSMNKGFMRYMKKHLEKEKRYQPILTLAIEIDDDHKDLSKKILEVMVSDEPISKTPSFQKIITNKIQFACPTLRRSSDTNLTENSIYIDFYIFRVIFEKVFRNEPSITLSVEDSGRNTRVLMYQKSFALGQGDESDMNNLKELIEELILDNEIKNRVKSYTGLYKQLLDYRKIDQFKNMVEELWTYIHGGGYLGGFDACNLCDPRKLSPRSSKEGARHPNCGIRSY